MDGIGISVAGMLQHDNVVIVTVSYLVWVWWSRNVGAEVTVWLF